MKLKTVIDEIRQEVNVLTGDDTKDKIYSSQHTFPDELRAQEAFTRSKEKLFNVNSWSDLSSFTADFFLHDRAGLPVISRQPQIGEYIKIVLPGPIPENWVEIIDIVTTDLSAEFTVRPSKNPQQNGDEAKIEHFFQPQARSTFRVERESCTVRAYEIGLNEAINNKEAHSGDRAVINTLIAEAGWLFHQSVQWKTLTDYLVHMDS